MKREVQEALQNDAVPNRRERLFQGSERFTEELMQRFQIKNSQYGSTSDPFQNFADAAGFLGCSREETLIQYVLKHLSSLQLSARNDSLTAEDVRERAGDIIVYMWLLLGMVNERYEV